MARTVTIRNVTRDTVLADRAGVADTGPARSTGLLKHTGLEPGEGLFFTGGLIPPNQIHSIGMQFIFDAVFLDADYHVAHCIHSMKKWRISRMVLAARHLVELPPGQLKRCHTEVGDQIEITDNGDEE